MTRYGPWVQSPDYEEVVTWAPDRAAKVLAGEGFPVNTGGLLPASEFFDYATGYYSTLPYDRLDEMMSTQLALKKYLSAPFVAWNSLTYGSSVLGENDVRESGSSAMAGTSITPIVAGRPSNGPTGVSPFYWGPGAWPDGAVDVEYEGDGIASWLSVSLESDTVLSGVIGEQGPGGADEWPSVARRFQTDITVGFGQIELGFISTGGMTEYQADGATYHAAKRALGKSFDLTPYVSSGPYGSGPPLGLVTRNFIPPRTLPDGRAGQWKWTYGWGWHEARLRWTLRPPRYRWIYDTAPIRRTFPRDDGLAGGAGRTWPPPSSQQSSNRTFGGYL